jgi:fluoride ion exporter CrcB/FEX
MKPVNTGRVPLPKKSHHASEKFPVDPLSTIFAKRFFVYMILLVIALLWPFDLFKENRVDWISGSNGIVFTGEGMVSSPSPASALYHELVSGQGLTLDVWLAPANTHQAGPARIVSYSMNSDLRNFTLGQDGKNLSMRLRTTNTSLNGTLPNLVLADLFHSSEPMHIVVTYDYTYQTVYVNGTMHTQSELPGGDFTNWNPGCYLIFGNEVTGDRQWQGSLFQVSIYNRPLREEEIGKEYKKGWKREKTPLHETDSSPTGILARYRFDEGIGNRIHDTTSHADAIELYRPGFLRRPTSHYLRWPKDSLIPTLKSRDTTLNVIGFIPLGFLLHGALRNRRGRSLRLSVFVLFLGALLSFSFESMQYFSMSRDSSTVDLATNTLGTLIGIMIDRSYIKSVHHYWDRV